MSENHSILIVDDSNVIRSLLSITLKKQGFHVDSAANITEAEKYLSQHAYQLIILDYMLDLHTTGFTLVENLHNAHYPIPPVIMLSAEHSDNHRNAVKHLGIKAWMRKPFTPDNIIKLVNKVLGSA